MKFPILKAPIVVNVIIVIISAFISWFTLLFGIAHIIEGRNYDIPYSEHLKGVAVVTMLCIVGVVFLIITIAAIRGILHKLRQRGKP